MSGNYTRRDFVADSAKLALGAMIVPRHVLGGQGYQAPSDTLNIAMVGIGGMGMSNMSQLLSQNIVAICDVDFGYVDRSLAGRLRPNQEGVVSPESLKLRDAYVQAKKYADFREMLDKQKDIDAIVVATPDHLHAYIASAAMQMGKHVYVQKPLTYSVEEARLLSFLAKKTGVVTQMGNQGHSSEGTRRIMELIASGVIGPVRTVHVWTDRPVGYWAQGIPRPGLPTTGTPPQRTPEQQARIEASSRAYNEALAALHTAPQPETVAQRWSARTVELAVLEYMAKQPQTPPPGMNWDLFLGPVPEVPYHPAYHPFSWRGWTNFGVGAIGDMGAHLIDQPFWALGLEHPTKITASSSPWGGRPTDPATYPLATTVEYAFPARGSQPPVTLFWYDGGLVPPRPPHLPDEISLRGEGGGVFVGERGILMYETYGNNPKVYPESVAAEAERVPKTYPRAIQSPPRRPAGGQPPVEPTTQPASGLPTTHEMNWVEACKGRTKASSPFEYAALLTETMLLGIVALRAGQGKTIHYDGPNMEITNDPSANQYLTREYRRDWDL